MTFDSSFGYIEYEGIIAMVHSTHFGSRRKNGLGSILLLPTLVIAGCASDNDPLVAPSTKDAAAQGGAAGSNNPPVNTYVEDFTVGDLSFKRVWVPDVGQSGFDFNVWLDLTAKKAKEKVYVSIDFVRLDVGNASDLDVKSANFESDYVKIPVGAFVVDEMAQGETVHLDENFTLPANLPQGKYAAIFGVNQIDLFPEVNAAQGEVATANPERVLVAPATIIIGKPTKPNLRVLSSKLSEYYFTKPTQDPAGNGALPQRNIQVNFEIDSMALDCTRDVDLAFALNIGDKQYPLKVGVPVTDPTTGASSLSLLDRWTYKAGDVTIAPLPDDMDADELPLHSKEPIAVATQMPIGRTFDLYVPDQAFSDLAQDAKGQVVITIDPDNVIDEWGETLEIQKGDNVKRHAIQYLGEPPVDSTGTKGGCHTFYDANAQYGYLVKDMSKGDVFGNNSFNVSYGIRGVMSGGDTSVKFGSYNYLKGTIFGFGFSVLDANAELDSDEDCGSYYGYHVDVFGIRKYSGGEIFDAGEAKTLWEGDYKISKEYKRSTTLMVGGVVPIDVIGGMNGTLGVVPRVSVGPLLKLTGELAPYAELRGIAEGGVNLGVVRGGVGIDLRVIKLTATNTLWVELPFKTPKYQSNPPYTALTINYKLPLLIETLDGRFYLWGDRRNWRWQWKRIGELDVVNWRGLSWTYDIIPTQTKTFSLVSD